MRFAPSIASFWQERRSSASSSEIKLFGCSVARLPDVDAGQKPATAISAKSTIESLHLIVVVLISLPGGLRSGDALR
jgi:hypothetical protein